MSDKPVPKWDIADADERRAFWTSVMRGAVDDELGITPKLAERLKASELLGRACGDFKAADDTTVDTTDARARVEELLHSLAQKSSAVAPSGE